MSADAESSPLISKKVGRGMPTARHKADAVPGCVVRGRGPVGCAPSWRRWRPLGLDPLKRVEPFLDPRRQLDRHRRRRAGLRRQGDAERECHPLPPHALRAVRASGSTSRPAESDYEECGAFYSAQRNQAWYAAWNPRELLPRR